MKFVAEHEVMTGHLYLAACLSVAFSVLTAQADDWPLWRGPLGTGQSTEKSAPLTWSQTENVKWKVTLDGPSDSSPIVVGDKEFITHAPANSARRGLHCYDRRTGD